MPKITGVRSVQLTLKSMEKESQREDDGEVYVGYTAQYALHVHEAPPGTQFQRPGAQSKYLEQPARDMSDELADIIRKSKKRGVGLVHSIYLAGLRLQRASMQIVPVDTGNLRASAFTRILKS